MKNRIIYLDILKVLACILVIVDHTIYHVNINNNIDALIFCIIQSVSKIAVPIFFMITGALTLGKTYDFKKVRKCMFRIFVPLFIFSFIYFFMYSNYSLYNFKNFLIKFIEEPFFSLWYLYVLIGIYLCIPFLQKFIITLDDKYYKYFILIFLLLPSFLNLVSIVTNIKIYSGFTFSFFSYIIGYLVCGYYLSINKITKKTLCKSFYIFMLSWLILVSSMFIPYKVNGEIYLGLKDIYSTFTILMSICTFSSIKYFYEDKKISLKKEKFINNFAIKSFSIYLVQLIILDSSKPYFSYMLENYAYLGYFIWTLFIFLCSYLIATILIRIPVLKKYL